MEATGLSLVKVLVTWASRERLAGAELRGRRGPKVGSDFGQRTRERSNLWVHPPSWGSHLGPHFGVRS